MDPVGDHLVNDGEASSGVAVAAPGPRHSPLSGQPGHAEIYLTLIGLCCGIILPIFNSSCNHFRNLLKLVVDCLSISRYLV